MATVPLPLSILCDVSVSVTPAGVSVPAFNQHLIIDASGRIPSQGTNGRCILIPVSTWEASMVAAGYLTTDPAYIAFGLYASQSPAPQYGWVGTQDLTGISSISLGTTAGTGYTAGDTFLITQTGASYGYGVVNAVTAGVPTSLSMVTNKQGTGYSTANNLATVAQNGSAGTGLTVDIVADGETPLQAVTACRAASPDWYTVHVTTATDTDHLAIAAYAQTATPAMQYIYGTSSGTALTGATGNIFSLIKAADYGRAHGAYSTTQSGMYPNNAYIASAIGGRACGLNTGLANSNFSLAAKNLVGITTEPLTQAQINVFAGTPGVGFGNHGNCYGNYANSYDFYYQGINGNGLSFMTVLGLDMLAADAQISVLNVLQSLPSIPQTDSGQALVLAAVRGACRRAATRGFIASGVWSGATISLGTNNSLTAGDSVPNGYWVSSASFSTQSSADRALFKGMPVYVGVILAGTQQSFTIGVQVQQ